MSRPKEQQSDLAAALRPGYPAAQHRPGRTVGTSVYTATYVGTHVAFSTPVGVPSGSLAAAKSDLDDPEEAVRQASDWRDLIWGKVPNRG